MHVHHRANFYADRRAICVPGKNTDFSSKGTPLGATVSCYTFQKAPTRRADFKLQLTRNAATYRFRNIRYRGPTFWILGIPWGYRLKKGRLCVRDRYVPSCKVSCRSVSPSPRYLHVTGQIERQKDSITADLYQTKRILGANKYNIDYTQ